MKKSVKAALLSALVYPGVGHFILKKNIQAIVLAFAFTIPLYLMVSKIFAIAEQIVVRINNGEIPLNVVAISHALNDSLAGSNAQELNSKMYVLIIIWLIGVADSYRLGQKIQ